MKADATSADELYKTRLARIMDHIALKETDRVPFVFATRFWGAKFAGITFAEQMYDVDKAAAAVGSAVEFLDPDAIQAGLSTYGPTLEAFDYRPMAWPGHGADENVSFQYFDKEYMSAREYDEFLLDPTYFTLTRYLPRVAGACEGLEVMLDVASVSEMRFFSGLRAFARPEFRRAIGRLMEVGEHAEAQARGTGAFIRDMRAKGYPSISGGFCKAPFDHVADFLRGSKGAMLDMFRNRDRLLEMIDKVQALLVRGVVEETRATGAPFVFIPLHWGLDGFMSPDQFNTFYWPGLRKTVLHLIDNDITPILLWEGDCTSRLELIGDIPPGKAVYWFERTDLVRAREVLGHTICLRGNVPPSILITGTPDDIDAYCRNIIEKVGRRGGLILDGACSIPDEAPVANVKAMADSVKKYAF